jgi:ATP-dependent DNA ligase
MLGLFLHAGLASTHPPSRDRPRQCRSRAHKNQNQLLRGRSVPRQSDGCSFREQTAISSTMAVRRTDGFIEPCIPTLAAKPPSGPGWVHEIKHDGYRR